MKSLNLCFYVSSLCLFFTSCSSPSANNTDKAVSAGTTENSSGNVNNQKYEARTFEVKDSTGKSQGWGYDIYVDDHKTIHQPIIPGIQGTNSFKTEADAQKTGDLAVSKMKNTGSLPTLSIHELDSLGVTK